MWPSPCCSTFYIFYFYKGPCFSAVVNRNAVLFFEETENDLAAIMSVFYRRRRLDPLKATGKTKLNEVEHEKEKRKQLWITPGHPEGLHPKFSPSACTNVFSCEARVHLDTRLLLVHIFFSAPTFRYYRLHLRLAPMSHWPLGPPLDTMCWIRPAFYFSVLIYICAREVCSSRCKGVRAQSTVGLDAK